MNTFMPKSAVLIRAVALISTTFIAACGTPRNGYDPEATETLGRVVIKRDTDKKTYQRGGVLAHGPGGTRVVISPGPEMQVMEYWVVFEDGRGAVIQTWDKSHEVGGCVKLFESKTGRKDYPRMVNFYGCKPLPPAALPPGNG